MPECSINKGIISNGIPIYASKTTRVSFKAI